MPQATLANQLRQCQRDLGMVPAELMDVLSDDQIIDRYVTCSCCGEWVDEAVVPEAIQDATDEQHFLAISNAHQQSLSRAK